VWNDHADQPFRDPQPSAFFRCAFHVTAGRRGSHDRFHGSQIPSCMGKTEARDKPPDRVEAADYGKALPVITRFPLGIVIMKATTEDAVILADES